MKMDAIHTVVGDVQAGILRPLGARHAAYHFLSVHDPAAFKNFLKERQGLVTAESGAHGALPEHAVLLGVTFGGLRRLGVSEDRLVLLPEAFAQGMAERAELLGDVGRSAPERWDGRFGTGEIDVVICIATRADAPVPDELLRALWAREVLGAAQPPLPGAADGAPPGTRLLQRCRGFSRGGAREGGATTFGFRDGLSQPHVQGFTEVTAGQAAPGDAQPEPLWLGEFVLGHADEWERVRQQRLARGAGLAVAEPSASIAGGALGADLLANGSYMVFRKLELNGAAFRAEFCVEEPGGARRAAEAMGRWPNGAPLCDALPSAPSAPPQNLNDFTYVDAQGAPTLEGRHVPPGSHIRRAHPRSAQRVDSVRRQRIIRRGFSYEELRPGAGPESAHEERAGGLLFVCFNARIEDQFEFIQSVYLNGGNAVGLPSGAADPLSRFTTVRGGEYFFVPSRSALAQLAQDDFRAPAIALGQELLEKRAAQQADADARAAHFDPLDASSPALIAAVRRAGAAARPLSPQPADAPAGARVWFVGSAERVREVLGKPEHFSVGPYSQRIAEALAGEQLRVGLDPCGPGSAARQSRIELFERLILDHARTDAARICAITDAVLAQVEAGLDPQGLVDWVNQVARAVPAALMLRYLGIPSPQEISPGSVPSPARVAAHFGSLGETPAQWERLLRESVAARVARRELGPGVEQLLFWCRVLFAQTFGNLHARRELVDLAGQAGAEFRAHLRASLAALRARPAEASEAGATVLGRGLRLQRPGRTQEEQDRELELFVLELAVGGTDTVARGITHLLGVLLARPAALEQVRAAVQGGAQGEQLERLVHECLRFEPVASMVPRRCERELAGREYRPGDVICVLLALAARDPEAFPEPEAFCTERPLESYLTFGHGIHACAGRGIALPVMGRVLQWLFGADASGAPRFAQVRRSAGRLGRRNPRELLPDAFYVRLR